MPRFGSALLFLVFASSAWAQSTVPGTFNATPAQPSVVITAPLLTPPIISYGAGVNGGPAILNGQVAVPLGESASINQGYISAAGYVPMPRASIVSGQTTSGAETNQAANRPAPFDFVVAPSAGRTGEMSSAGVGDGSLGQLAAAMRKGPPPTQRKFSNDDIARMNGVTNNNYPMPGASTTQPQYPQQQQVPQAPPHSELGNAPLPPGAKPSPFSPKPSAAANPPTQDSSGTEPTQLAQNQVPQQPAAESQQQPAPDSANAEPTTPKAPSSATASTEPQLPASGSLLPMFAMLGGAAVLTGYVLNKRG